MVVAGHSARSNRAGLEAPGGVEDFWEQPSAAYLAVRAVTKALCDPLEIEDFGLQSMADASPVKWHLAHTSWFFETFVLLPWAERYSPFHPRFGYLFNSYYETVGRMHPRPQRGLLSRPTVAEIWAYREHVDSALLRWLDRGAGHPEQLAVVELGLHHEQQHQELILTDLKHGFWQNPLRPAYRQRVERRPLARDEPSAAAPQAWVGYAGGIERFGAGPEKFHFDNEGPAHDVLLQPFEVGDRLVSCGEYLEFVRDGGYARAELWLSAGWAAVQQHRWSAPLYWEQTGDAWSVFTMHGMQPLNTAEPVCHVSLFEADAFARWAGGRLPSEFEWEHSMGREPLEGNLQDAGLFHPQAATASSQAFGDVWVWTRSAYAPYPGYRAPRGALGEYNGKFMCSQHVLRGGSCATPRGHLRPTYRNFFYPPDRWQFSGIRLARDV